VQKCGEELGICLSFSGNQDGFPNETHLDTLASIEVLRICGGRWEIAVLYHLEK
jgi:hypothetical protein